jgi:hypothetical protein
MTVYNTNKAGATPKWLPDSGGCSVFSIYTFGTSGLPTLTAGDTIVGPTVPAGVTVTEVLLDVDKLDGGGSPALVLKVGDAGVTNRYISGSTVGQNGGYQVPNIAGATGYVPAANAPVIITVVTTANGAVPASANVRLLVSYSADV